MDTCDKRSKNFTSFEKSLLVDLVLQRKGILENKRTDGATLADKKHAWEDLCEAFNASNQSGKRTPKQLKELYFVMKRKARKNNNEDRIGCLQTGGGTYNPKSDVIDEKIVAGLKSQFECDRNPFDSSASLFNDIPIIVTCESDILDAGLATPSTSNGGQAVEIVTPGESNIDLELNGGNVSEHEGCTPLPSKKLKRKTNYLDSITESIITSKRVRNSMQEEVSLKKSSLMEEELNIKKRELEMKEVQHNKKCEILDIEKQIKITELKLKELEYKIKLKEYESM